MRLDRDLVKLIGLSGKLLLHYSQSKMPVIKFQGKIKMKKVAKKLSLNLDREFQALQL